MKNILVASCVSLWALTLLSGCGGSGSHATDGGKDSGKDSGTDSGTGGADSGTDGGTDAGTDGGSCPGAGACGGNIVGTWSIASSCLSVDVSGSIPDDCPTATAQPVNFQIRGTITYKADLTYVRQSTFSGGVAITYPGTCLTGADGGAPRTCAQLMQELQLDVTYTAVSCVAAGSGCTCTGTLAPETTQSKTGMYTTTSAGLLTETETGRGAPDMSNYCIMANTLTTSPRAMGSSASGTITATRVVVPDAGGDAIPDASGDAVPEAGGDAPKDGGGDAVPEAGGDAGASDAPTGN